MTAVANNLDLDFGRESGHLIRAAGAASDGVAEKLLRAFRKAMMARMLGVLGDMTDEQLARIGIDRAGVPAYAHKLTFGDA